MLPISFLKNQIEFLAKCMQKCFDTNKYAIGFSRLLGLKIKNRRLLYKTLPLAFLLVAAFLLSTNLLYSQDSLKKTYPDGTTGLVLEVGPDDYLAKSKKPWNEFEGTYSTFRFGLGYILDGAAYSQNSVFKKQMDSAGLGF